MLARANSRFSAAVIVTLDTNTDENASNRDQLLASLREVSSIIEELDADDNRFGVALERILACRTGKGHVVVVDISSFANRALLKVMAAVIKSNCTLEILYCEAEEYKPTEAEYLKDPASWQLPSTFGLERGVSSVQGSTEYPGFHPDPLPDLVFLIPNMNPGRSMAVVTAVDASIVVEPEKRIVWIVGIPHELKDRWRAQAMRQINSISPRAKAFDVSTFEYKELLPILLNIHEQNAESYRMTLSPLGSKLQSLAVAMFLYMKPDVRVMFSVPQEYNAKNYSIGVRDVWRIALGDTEALRQELDAVGTLRLM